MTVAGVPLDARDRRRDDSRPPARQGGRSARIQDLARPHVRHAGTYRYLPLPTVTYRYLPLPTFTTYGMQVDGLSTANVHTASHVKSLINGAHKARTKEDEVHPCCPATLLPCYPAPLLPCCPAALCPAALHPCCPAALLPSALLPCCPLPCYPAMCRPNPGRRAPRARRCNGRVTVL